MQRHKFVVRRNDAAGNPKSREYDTEPAAKKAKQWLIDNGALDADIAVVVGGKTYNGGGAIPDGAKPNIEQQTFIK